ncbi:MAG TPA: helix-turn-helix transcriptional regulator [Chitinophagaceae bacterium]
MNNNSFSIRGGSAKHPLVRTTYKLNLVRTFYFTYIYVINQEMKGTNLGEFEELVLLAVAASDQNAYSVAICDELSEHTDRDVKLGVVHAVLNRLEEKGLIKSRLGEATAVRGGKRKRLYGLTAVGKTALVKSKEMRDQLWARIPRFTLKNI